MCAAFSSQNIPKFPPCVKSYHKMSLIFLNGDSLTKASSRHSMVCEAKILKKKKKQEIKKEFCWKKILIIYLKCNAVKEFEKKEKKSLCFGVKRPIMKKTTAISADTCVCCDRIVLIFFFVISMVQTIWCYKYVQNYFEVAVP